MPTKKQLHQIWESEMEFPETRRNEPFKKDRTIENNTITSMQEILFKHWQKWINETFNSDVTIEQMKEDTSFEKVCLPAMEEYAILYHDQKIQPKEGKSEGEKLYSIEEVKELLLQQRHICQIERDKRSLCVNGLWYVNCEDVKNAKEPVYPNKDVQGIKFEDRK